MHVVQQFDIFSELAAQMLDRPVRLVDALGVAAIAILAWRPADLFDPSRKKPLPELPRSRLKASSRSPSSMHAARTK